MLKEWLKKLLDVPQLSNTSVLHFYLNQWLKKSARMLYEQPSENIQSSIIHHIFA